MTEPHNNPSPPLISTPTGEATVSLPPPPSKKKRSLPGMPDPDAEVISLSPKTLLTTNRFVCEICNKGFQRDQNLQLHRRGHNLPWKLRQRESKEIRKKVYVCPEPSCVHHNPSRALGDLTGIKKHFCRKHGEKKWKCERCSKKYAVQSDWKAHMKTCGTREYRCHCGTLFSRRDSFMTHRASCNVLAEESGGPKTLAASPPTPPLTPSSHVVSPSLSIHSSDIPENPTRLSPTSTSLVNPVSTGTPTSSTTCSTVFASVLTSSTAPSTSSFSNLMSSLACSDCPTSISTIEPTSLSLSTSLYLSNNEQSLFPDQHDLRHYTAPQPALSATALLQKAAQMGASNASLLRGLGLTTTTSFFGKDDTTTTITQWNGYVKQEADDNLGLELPCGNEGVMMNSSPPFVGQPMTRDLLGLSIGVGASRGGLSALLTSFDGNLDSSGDRGVQQ